MTSYPRADTRKANVYTVEGTDYLDKDRAIAAWRNAALSSVIEDSYGRTLRDIPASNVAEFIVEQYGKISNIINSDPFDPTPF